MALICQLDYVLKLEAHSELPIQDGQFTIKKILNNILDISHKYDLYYNHVRKVLIANEYIKPDKCLRVFSVGHGFVA